MTLFEYIKSLDEDGMATYLSRFTLNDIPDEKMVDPAVIHFVHRSWKIRLKEEVNEYGRPQKVLP